MGGIVVSELTAKGRIAMRHAGFLVVFAFVTFALVGCANPAVQFYHPVVRADLPADRFVPPTGPIEIYAPPANHQDDERRMLENGFEIVGWMSFNGRAGAVSQSQLIEQARKVGASIVTAWSGYTNTVSGVLPYTTTAPSQVVTSSSSGTVNVQGSGGSATGNYSGTTSTLVPGASTTQLIPYNVSRYDYTAIFWAKRRHFIFGAYWNDLTSEQRARLQRNGGVTVKAVVKGTPAFNGNILVGDLILKVNGRDIGDNRDLSATTTSLAGQVVKFDLLRGDEAKTVEIRLNE